MIGKLLPEIEKHNHIEGTCCEKQETGSPPRCHRMKISRVHKIYREAIGNKGADGSS